MWSAFILYTFPCFCSCLIRSLLFSHHFDGSLETMNSDEPMTIHLIFTPLMNGQKIGFYTHL